MKRILFIGELYPSSIHGIAIANRTNIELLKEKFHIDIIEEKKNITHHSKTTFRKIINIFKLNRSIIKTTKVNYYDYLYIVFSLSTFGSLKTISSILCFKLFCKGKVIIHIHRGDFFTRFYKSLINKVFTSLILNKIDLAIVLSENQKKEFVEKFRINCEVLTNTVENEYPLKQFINNKKKFIYISNYLLDKGIIDLLTVFKKITEKHSNIHLETYGSFSDEKLKQKILCFSSNNIKINEAIKGDKKYKIICDSDCLILPSWNEGQPIVLLEAMSLGTPVITTKVGLIPELLGADYPFLATQRDLNSLEEVILKFIASDNLESIMSDLYENYSTNYSINNHKNTLLTIFK